MSHLPSLSKPASTALIALSSASVYMFEDKIGNTLTKFLHLGSISAWFGTQLWVTFAAGNLKMLLHFHSLCILVKNVI